MVHAPPIDAPYRPASGTIAHPPFCLDDAMSDDAKNRAALKKLLGISGARGDLDESVVYRLQFARPLDQVLTRIRAMTAPLHHAQLALQDWTQKPTHTEFMVSRVSRWGEPIIVSWILVQPTDTGTTIYVVDYGGLDPDVSAEHDSAPFKNFWALFQQNITPPSYDEVIRYWQRAKARNPKVTLKAICERLGANYESVLVQRSRAKAKKKRP
jgi:hypothetical protein